MQAVVSTAKLIGSVMLGVIGIAILGLLAAIFLVGVVAISKLLEPFLFKAFTLTLVLGIVLVLFALIPKTRQLALFGYLLAEKITSLILVLHAILITWSFWGVFAVCLGLLFAGIGIVPVALACMIWNREWAGFGDLIILIISAIAFRGAALWVARKMDIDAERRFL
jgi:hypothetical protein